MSVAQNSSSRTRRASDSGTTIVGVDTGGTFTDLVAIIRGELRVHKVLSTPADPADAVIRGLAEMLADDTPAAVTYSSTVATNALLEKKGARVALITNAGFEDVIEIGRQNRDDLYALAPSRPEPLVSRAMRFGIAERTLFDGTTIQPLTNSELARIRKLASAIDAEAFAICLLHSYANPKSEEAIARTLKPLGRPLSVSHRILAEYREYERFSTAVVNAYVAPRMSSHLQNLETRLKGARLRVMQSNGSAIGAELARVEPIRTILSGPAAGVVGAATLASAIGTDRFITFDMGGTSTDVSLFDRRARIRTLSHPEGYAVRTPVIDIHTVGAGGGSIARIDAGGSLQVGPQSAGADPGPACYGRGDAATVTDADLVAGRLVAENFLGGKMKLQPERAARALSGLAHKMKSTSAAAARGVIRVVNANMERAIRVITVERGYDPRDFALLAFGGAGPMHACELALDLGIRHIVMPQNPGLLCAWGAVGAPLGREYSLTVRETNPNHARLLHHAAPMIRRVRDELKSEGAAKIEHELWVDMRYRGQSYELEVALTPRFVAEFHSLHRQTFGHAAPDAAVEVVNIRIRAIAAGKAPTAPKKIARMKSKAAPISRRSVMVGNRERIVSIYARDSLGAGTRLRGPVVVVELSSTAYVAPEFELRVDDFGNLQLEAAR
ncbi:MAG: hydantoinase/oxoprolinase family protein [Candidatus Binatus sp.]|uniref:hydantoinase/oxoprolinase family protein n=1 Tax=Candidatus Binatus sp. TaxID=2811406 RepID=UPI0027180F0A|nr:hydantoinase/oxoprolinase family protein [Candidatus Binatus sp.]MDO8434144.1 hydantoinase/oxoprolinase family protein [Candidatus Binatus sp.]